MPAGVRQSSRFGGDHVAAGLKPHAGVDTGAIQDLEQGGAVDAQGRARAVQIGVANIEHDPTAPGLAPEQAVNRLGQGLDRRCQAEGVENGQPGRLEHKAGPDRPGLFEAFEDDHVPPLSRQHQGGGEAGGTGSDNGDFGPRSPALRDLPTHGLSSGRPKV